MDAKATGGLIARRRKEQNWSQGDLAELSEMLYSAGVDRITPLDSMSASYSGEPHDGGYALPKFMRRVSL